ncbi:hypothetical protein HPB47_021718, partial [Ixodes persulcatus]
VMARKADVRKNAAAQRYQVSPSLVYQVYTVHGLYHDAVIPLLYALLLNKKEDTYRRCECYPRWHSCHLHAEVPDAFAELLEVLPSEATDLVMYFEDIYVGRRRRTGVQTAMFAPSMMPCSKICHAPTTLSKPGIEAFRLVNAYFSDPLTTAARNTIGELEKQGTAVYLQWIAGHVGVKGNEKADSLATEAHQETASVTVPTDPRKARPVPVSGQDRNRPCPEEHWSGSHEQRRPSCVAFEQTRPTPTSFCTKLEEYRTLSAPVAT